MKDVSILSKYIYINVVNNDSVHTFEARFSRSLIRILWPSEENYLSGNPKFGLFRVWGAF